MNKRGFVNPLAIVVSYLVFIALWFMFFANQINYWSQNMIELNSLTGIEAFLMANFNLWIFIVSLLAVIGGVYITGGGE